MLWIGTHKYSYAYVCGYEFRMMNIVLILMNHCDSTARRVGWNNPLCVTVVYVYNINLLIYGW